MDTPPKHLLWIYVHPANEVVGKLLKSAYRRAGIDLKIDEVHDVATGVAAIADSKPDSVLVIHDFPRVDALETVKRIRAKDREIPIHVVVDPHEQTYCAVPAPVEEIREAGATKVHFEGQVISHTGSYMTHFVGLAHPQKRVEN